MESAEGIASGLWPGWSAWPSRPASSLGRLAGGSSCVMSSLAPSEGGAGPIRTPNLKEHGGGSSCRLPSRQVPSSGRTGGSMQVAHGISGNFPSTEAARRSLTSVVSGCVRCLFSSPFASSAIFEWSGESVNVSQGCCAGGKP